MSRRRSPSAGPDEAGSVPRRPTDGATPARSASARGKGAATGKGRRRGRPAPRARFADLSRPPVLFLGLPMAVNVRDVLRTDVFPRIRRSGVEVHLFTPAAEVEAFREEFGGPGVHLHPLERPPAGPWDRVDGLILRFHVLLLSLRCDTARIMIAGRLEGSVWARMLRDLLDRAGRGAQDRLLSWTRRLTLRHAPELYADAFERYRPDLVVGTRAVTMTGSRADSSARYLDRFLLVSAARRDVPAMVLVSSWDNLTTSGFFPVDVDRITVWNEIMREQAVEVHGIDPARVTVTGAPQHDVYARKRAFVGRKRFFDPLGLDPRKKVAVFTTQTEGTIPDEPELVGRLIRALRWELPNLQVLVRVHQLDRLERYQHLKELPAVALDQAGNPRVGAYHDRDFDRAQLERLADTLRHADVVVNTASSISIDAAAVGTPVVVVDFDYRPGLPYERSLRRFYDFTHQQPVVRSGGVYRARTPDELVSAVRRYLADPATDAVGRERLVREQCHAIDGQSGERVAEAVLSELERAARAR